MEVFVNGCRLLLLIRPLSLSVSGSACFQGNLNPKHRPKLGIGQLVSFKIQTFEQAGAENLDKFFVDISDQKIWEICSKKKTELEGSTIHNSKIGF